MKRTLELILILVFVIVLSLFVSVYEPYIDGAKGIDNTNQHFSTTGVTSVMGCANSGPRSDIRFAPNLDDLIASKSLKAEHTKGLLGVNSISSRSCSDNKDNSSLFSALSSNKSDCELTIDGQTYELRARDINLVFDVRKSSSTELHIANDAALTEFVLLRPVMFVVADSKPYNINMGNANYFVHSTQNIQRVKPYNSFPKQMIVVPITPASGSLNIFPTSQVADIGSVFRNKMQAVAQSGGGNPVAQEIKTTVYYLNRIGNRNLDTVVVENSEVFSKLVSKEAMKTVLTKVRSGDIKNPVFTVKFRCSFMPDVSRKTYLNSRKNLVSIAKTRDGAIGYDGRGILLVSTRPENLRKDIVPIQSGTQETVPSDPNWVCLDFMNVEKNSLTGGVSSNEGFSNNCVSLWVPANTNVEVIYIVGPSFKVAAATYYNPTTNQRHLTFVHSFHCNNIINDVLFPVTTQMNDLALNNLAKGGGLERELIIVSNLEAYYGMDNLEKWFSAFTN